MGTPTFRELQASLHNGDANDEFPCIAKIAYAAERCSNIIPKDLVQKAIPHLQRDIADISVNSVRKIIRHLVCEQHQSNGNYNYKNKIKDKWALEFPDGFFRRGDGPSTPQRTAIRNSLTPATPTPPRRHASGSTPSDSLDQSPSPEGASSPQTLYQGADSDVENNRQGQTVNSGVETEDAAFTAADIGLPLPTEEEADVQAPPDDLLPSEQGDGRSPRRGTNLEVSDDFSHGDTASFAPWTIQERVCALLLEPLDPDRGCIYVIQEPKSQHVKIGVTMKKANNRLKQLSNEHNLELDKRSCSYISGIPYVQLCRLEKLVHADLAFFQRNRPVRKGQKVITRREWFAVDLPIARKTVKMWWAIMSKNNMEPGGEINPTAREALQHIPASDVEIFEGEDEAQAWERVNKDHKHRMQTWTSLLLPKEKTKADIIMERVWAWLGSVLFKFVKLVFVILIWPLGQIWSLL